MYSTDRTTLRRVFVDLLERLDRGERARDDNERRLAQVLVEHPEYHPLLRRSEAALARDFPAEAGAGNPFLHMALHLSLREQRALGQPEQVARLHRQLALATGQDDHAIEHAMMECLSEAIWQAQQSGAPASERVYLKCLARLGMRYGLTLED